MMPAPSPISGSAPDGAAMLEVLEDLQPVLDDPVRLLVLQVDDEADAAGIVLALGVGRRRRHGAHAFGRRAQRGAAVHQRPAFRRRAHPRFPRRAARGIRHPVAPSPVSADRQAASGTERQRSRPRCQSTCNASAEACRLRSAPDAPSGFSVQAPCPLSLPGPRDPASVRAADWTVVLSYLGQDGRF